jgi:hypothetical protein
MMAGLVQTALESGYHGVREDDDEAVRKWHPKKTPPSTVRSHGMIAAAPPCLYHIMAEALPAV